MDTPALLWTRCLSGSSAHAGWPYRSCSRTAVYTLRRSSRASRDYPRCERDAARPSLRVSRVRELDVDAHADQAPRAGWEKFLLMGRASLTALASYRACVLASAGARR